MLADPTMQTLLGARPSAIAEEPAWLTDGRAAARQRFAQLGLPTPRNEAWRFTDLRPLRAALSAQANASISPHGGELTPHRLTDAHHRLVFVDGRLDSAQSRVGLLRGVWCGSMAEALATRPELAEAALSAADAHDARPFAALNAAQFTDGMLLALEPGVVMDRPLELVCLRMTPSGPPVQLRHCITLGAGSQATVVESAFGDGAGCSNHVTTAALADQARLTYVKLQAEPDTALHLAELRVQLGRAAKLDGVFLSLGGRLSRQDIQVALAGEDAELALHGTYLLRGAQEAVIAPFVDHRVANCRTTELFKAVLDDAAHGVFLGSIAVREGADGTQAHQQNRNLLISRTARADTRPELTIYADEVKCSHGATVGDLDESALFYLQARGLTPAAARAMLIDAFAAEPIDAAALPPAIRDWLHFHLAAWLGTGEVR